MKQLIYRTIEGFKFLFRLSTAIFMWAFIIVLVLYSITWLRKPEVKTIIKEPEVRKSLVKGDSMTEYGYPDGEYNVYWIEEEPEAGDFALIGLEDKKQRAEAFGDEKARGLFKKVVKKNEDGCLWIEGNKEPRYVGDKVLISIDSNVFGWVCDYMAVKVISPPTEEINKRTIF